MRLKGSHRTAAIILGICVIWIASGIFTRSDEIEQKAKSTAITSVKKTQVRYIDSVSQPTTAKIILTGKSIAHRKTDLRSETSGRVIEIVKDRGARVQSGDTLIRLADDNRSANLRQARSLLTQRDTEYKAAQRLSSKAFTSRIKLAAAKAERDKAAAVLSKAQLNYNRTQIKAPFDGIFDTRTVNIGDYLSIGSSVGKVLDLDPLDIEVQLTEDHIHQVKAGAKATITTPDGLTHIGTVQYVAASAESSTRTFAVRIAMDNASFSYSEGMTIRVQLPLGQTQAHLISPAILTLSPKGDIGIHAINKNNTVMFYPVTPISEDAAGLWVSGLPETLHIITVGQDYVKAGQEVIPQPETSYKNDSKSMNNRKGKKL